MPSRHEWSRDGRTPTLPFARSSRRKPRRWPLVFRFIKGAIHTAIVLPVCLHAIFATIIVYIDLNFDARLRLPTSIIPSLSIVVGLMLVGIFSFVCFLPCQPCLLCGIKLNDVDKKVFRNQTAYNRFWDGRNHLSQVITTIRNLARCFLACTSPPCMNKSKGDHENCEASASETEEVVRILIAVLYAVKDHLRAEWGAERIPGFATPEHASSTDRIREYQDLLPSNLKLMHDQGLNLPLELTVLTETYIHRQFNAGVFHGPQAAQMEAQLNSLTDAFGRMETIRLTSIPVALLIHQKQVLALFGAVLPFALVEMMRWWSVMIVAMVMFSLYGIDGIGAQLEDPFGFDRNDINMDAIVEDIREEVTAMLIESKSAVRKQRRMFLG